MATPNNGEEEAIVALHDLEEKNMGHPKADPQEVIQENREENIQEDRDDSSHEEVHEDNVSHPDEEQTPSPTAVEANTNEFKEYRSWKNSWWMMSIAIFVEVSLIVTIIVLERISAARDGIRSVPQISASSVSLFSTSTIWRYGLLWTTLPSLVMSAYRTMWEVVVSESTAREPFVELAKPKNEAANAKLTILLDYSSIASYRSWLDAFRNRHFHLGFAMLLTFATSFAIVPLTAHLFVTAPAVSNATTHVSRGSVFNDSALTGQSNLQPAFDLATAMRIYGSPPPPYMTTEYAFVPLDTVNLTTGNVTVPTYAYSAYLDCQEVTNTSSGYSAVYSPSDVGSITLSFIDRGCHVVGQAFPVASDEPQYALSWYSSCAGQQYNRIGVFMGQYSASSPIHLDPFTIISCGVSYSRTYGSLTISLQHDQGPLFVSFAAQNSTYIRPFLYQTLESELHTYSFFDPSGTFRSDSFGLYTYFYALKLNNTATYTPSVLITAIGNYFTTFYASLANTVLFTPAPAQSVTASVSTASTRLFVVSPVAYSIVAVLSLAVICTIILFIHSLKVSILREEPVGLLGGAVLVEGSGLEAFMKEFKKRHEDVDEVMDYVKKHYTVDTSRCYADEERRVVVDGLVEKEISTKV